jgi:nitroreductase
MDIYTAIKERRSCRKFLSEPVDEGVIEKILEAAAWAPSPMNFQPWEFVVVSNEAVKEKIHAEVERCRQWAIGASGWKWLEKYSIDFLLSTPVIIAVVGDPGKSGLDMFMEGGGVAYQHACAAAIQNIQLSAHAEGLASLWFTMFDKTNLGDILDVTSEKAVVGLVCLGKADGDLPPVPRKDIKKKTTFLR